MTNTSPPPLTPDDIIKSTALAIISSVVPILATKIGAIPDSLHKAIQQQRALARPYSALIKEPANQEIQQAFVQTFSEAINSNPRFRQIALAAARQWLLRLDQEERLCNHNLTDEDYEPAVRKDLVETLCRRIGPGSTERPRVTFVFGLSGMGKTTVAKAVARRLAPERYAAYREDRFLYVINVDLAAEVKTQATAEEAIAVSRELILREISNVTQSGYHDPAVLDDPSQLRDVFGKYPSLLLIDGLAAEAQVAISSLIKKLPRNVKILITSSTAPNSQLDAEWDAHQLNVLSDAEAQALLIEKLKRRGGPPPSAEQLPRIGRVTGGIPIAIQLYAGMASSAGHDLAIKLARKLPADPKTNFIGAAVRRSKESAALADQLLLALASCPAPVCSKTLAAITRKAVDDVELGLWELQKQCLIEWGPRGTFSVLDLIRDYALTRFGSKSKLHAIDKARVAHYSNLRNHHANSLAAWTIFTDYQPDGPDQIDFAMESKSIVATIEYCLKPENREHLWKSAAKMVDDFRAVLFFGGYWAKRMQFCADIIQQAKSRTDPESLAVLGRTQRLLAWMHCFKDQHIDGQQTAQAALTTANQGLALVESGSRLAIQFRQTQYKALNTLGQIELRQGQFHTRRMSRDLSKSETHLKQAQVYFKNARAIVERHFSTETTIVDYHLAEVEYYSRYQQTPRHLRTARELIEPVHRAALSQEGEPNRPGPHWRMAAHCLYYLGKIERRRASLVSNPAGAYQSAEGKLDEAMALAKLNNDVILMARIQYAKGQLCYDKAGYLKNSSESNSLRYQADYLLQLAAGNLRQFGMHMEADDANDVRRRLREEWVSR